MGKLAELCEAARREAQEASGRLALAPVLQEMRECRAQMAELGTLLQALPDAIADRVAPALETADRLGNPRNRGTPASGGGATPGGASASEERTLDAQAWTDMLAWARRRGETRLVETMERFRAAAAARQGQ